MVYSNPGKKEGSANSRGNDRSSSPSDVYRFNGDFARAKRDDGNLEENILQQLFKENESAGLPSKLCAQPPSQNSHAHPYKVEQNWRQMAQLAKPEDFGFQGSTSFGGSSRSYLGGPNVTPTYNKITGELLQSNKSESSSSNSESDSSPTHSHTGAFEPNYKIKDAQKETTRLNKDEKIARAAGIRFNIKQDIVNPPMDEFNDMLSKEDLTEEQLNICRDIRRRGKNKVAAQNCRKRKLEQIEELQIRLDEARKRQHQLQDDHEKLLHNYSTEANRLTRLTDTVLAHHKKSPHQYLVHVVGDDIKILPKSAVPENERFPQPVDRLRMSCSAESYPNYYSNLYSNNMAQAGMGQCVANGWE